MPAARPTGSRRGHPEGKRPPDGGCGPPWAHDMIPAPRSQGRTKYVHSGIQRPMHRNRDGGPDGFVIGAQPRADRAGGAAGAGGGAPRQRAAELHVGRAGRHGSERSARTRALGDRQRRARIPQQQAHHGQSGAGRPAQGLGPLRPADRARHPGRGGPDRRFKTGRLGVRG